jgi:hypothetical protein
MAHTTVAAAIHDPRPHDMRIHAGDQDPDTAYLYLDYGNVWFALNRRNTAAAQADAMDRLAELATQAAAWLRGGDLHATSEAGA